MKIIDKIGKVLKQYEYFIADQKYANIAKRIGLKADTVEEGVNSLIKAIQELNEKVNIPKMQELMKLNF